MESPERLFRSMGSYLCRSTRYPVCSGQNQPTSKQGVERKVKAVGVPKKCESSVRTLRVQGLSKRSSTERESNISARLLRYRLESGLSQKELGELINATQSQVSRWETNDITMSSVRKRDVERWLENNTVV